MQVKYSCVMYLCLLQGLEENMGYLVGDCLLAASFLSYMGPFLSNYRDELLSIWMNEVTTKHTMCPAQGFGFKCQTSYSLCCIRKGIPTLLLCALFR